MNGGGGANEESICSPFVRSFVRSFFLPLERERVLPRLASSIRTRCSLPPRREAEKEKKRERERERVARAEGDQRASNRDVVAEER